MPSTGDPNALIVNSQFILKQGTDEYILKNNVTLDVSRPRIREAINMGPVNTFGAGDTTIPVTFEADITKTANWVNLNARDQITGHLPNLPYSLTVRSKPYTPGGSLPSITASITDGKISSTNISSPGSNLTGSIALALTGGTPDRVGKMVAIVSGGAVVEVVVIDAGEGYDTAPTVNDSHIGTPFSFAFNAEVGEISLSQSDSEGRLKIDALLIVTDDSVLPVS